MKTYLAQVKDHGTNRILIDPPRPWHFVTDDGNNISVTHNPQRQLFVPMFEVGSQVTWHEVGEDYEGSAALIAQHIIGYAAETARAMAEYEGDSLIVLLADLPLVVHLPTGFNVFATIGIALCHGEPTFDSAVEAMPFDGVWQPSVEQAVAAVRQVPPPKHKNGVRGRKSQRLWAEQVASNLTDALLAVPI